VNTVSNQQASALSSSQRSCLGIFISRQQIDLAAATFAAG